MLSRRWPLVGWTGLGPVASLLLFLGMGLFALLESAQLRMADPFRAFWMSVAALSQILGFAYAYRKLRGVEVTRRQRALELKRQLEERSEHLLSRAGALLVESLEVEERIPRLLSLALEGDLGDFAVAVLLDEREEVDRVASVARPAGSAAQSQWWEAVMDRRHTQAIPAGVGEALRTRDPITEENLATFLQPDFERLPELRSAWERGGLSRFLSVPLRSREQALGTLAFYAAPQRGPFTPADVTLAQKLADEVAMAIDNARLYRRAQRETLLREELLALVSHDLKNPIGAILASAHVASMQLRALPSAPERLITNLERIDASARATLRLISDLNDYANIQAGGLSVSPAVHRAVDVVEQARTLLEPLAFDRGISLQAAALSDELWICCDRDRVLQVFSNVVGNALKFSPPGATVTVSAEKQDRHLCFSVADEGPGISEEELPKIFERYWKADRGDRRGLGLGLFIT
ncbi:MAG: GAF domain-containing sensor histidine kinase, partial [Myxococcaceae bacterium]